MSRAALRYAKAFLSLADDQKKVEQVNEDMKTIAQVISENQELDALIKSAIIKSDIKKSTLDKVFSSADTLTKGLFQVLISNKRVDILHEVAVRFEDLYKEYKGQETAVVTTAVPMTNDLEIKVLAKIKELTNKAVTVNNIVDETILGGFILRVGDKEYNASIANKLNKLKREFTLN